MENNYDAILYVTPDSINEDERYQGSKNPSGIYKGPGIYVNADDPKLYASNAFGQSMQSELNNMGKGYNAEVTDLGKWVVVRISYHNVITGRSASKTFLVVFTNKANGLVMSASNKWRTISGYSQAISYIKSVANTLQSSTSSKL